MKNFFQKAWIIIKKVWLWLVLSSENPKKYSLTIKATLTAVVTMVTTFAGIAGIGLPQTDWAMLIDTILMIIQQFLTAIALIAGLVGLVKKVGSTIQGTNQVVNTHPLFTGEDQG